MTSQLKTIDEVADYLRVSRTTVYTLVREGKLPASKVGREWRVKTEDVDKYLQENQVTPEDEG